MTRPAMPKAKKAPVVWWCVVNRFEMIIFGHKLKREAKCYQAFSGFLGTSLIRVTETAPPVKRRGRK